MVSCERRSVLEDEVGRTEWPLFCGDEFVTLGDPVDILVEAGDTLVADGVTLADVGGDAANESVKPLVGFVGLGRVGGGGPADPKLLPNESPKPVGGTIFCSVNLVGIPKASLVVDMPNASLEPVRFAVSLGASLGGGAGAPNESPKPPGDGACWCFGTPNASTLLCLVLD